MIRTADYPTLGAGACIAGFCTGISTNVFEVIKTRSMNQTVSGQPGKTPTTFSSIGGVFRFFQKEGFRQMFSGIGYYTLASMLRPGSIFPVYEYIIRDLNQKKETNPTLRQLSPVLPGVVGFSCKLVSQVFLFPLEYLSALSQGGLSSNKKQFSNGFGFSLGRELVFSAFFFGFQEALHNNFKKSRPEASQSRANYITASFLSSMAAALISFPFDLLRTWKISYPEKFRDQGSVGLAKSIYKEKGLKGFSTGNKVLKLGIIPRMMRVGGGNLIFFWVYTKSIQEINHLREKKQ